MTSLIVIYGDGRGKTSNSIGYIYKKAVDGKSIKVAQFLKTCKQCGECDFFKSFSNVKWNCYGSERFYHNENKEEFVRIIGEGCQQLKEELSKRDTDILLLDEVGIALHFNLVSWEQIEELFQFVKEEVIITGRKIPKFALKYANISIYLKEIKHPYNLGMQARKGIDY